MSNIPNPLDFQYLNTNVPKVSLPSTGYSTRIDGCNTSAFYTTNGNKYQNINDAYGKVSTCAIKNNKKK